MSKVHVRVTFIIGILQILSACFVWGRARICQGQPVADSQGTRSAKKNYNGPWQRTRTRVRNVATRFGEDPCDPVTEARMNDRIGLYKRVVSKDISQ